MKLRERVGNLLHNALVSFCGKKNHAETLCKIQESTVPFGIVIFASATKKHIVCLKNGHKGTFLIGIN